MALIHFLNVKEGDCNIIKHDSGRITVIDVCNASEAINEVTSFELRGNRNQKVNPTNPIEYMDKFEYKEIFRFILTHPDMDHMDGIKSLFKRNNPVNFWDTDNNKNIDSDEDFGQYSKEDWDFYQERRKTNVKHYLAGSKNKFYNLDDEGGDGDGLYILAPNQNLVADANKTKHYNDLSYVLLFVDHGRKIIFGGDSESKTWDYILENFKNLVKNIDVLIAPHHGRKTGGNSTYLDILNPKLTLFGNADSEDIDYYSYDKRGLKHYTNNQGGDFVLDVGVNGIDIYVTNKSFAIDLIGREPFSNYSAYYIETIR